MLLWRRSPWGELLGAAVAIWLFVYQLNFLVTTVFLADADVPGVTVDAVPIVTCVVFAVPPALLLWRRQASAHAASTIRSPGHRRRS